MSKPKIVCLIGKSGSGKSTIAEWLETRHGIKQIQSYTTRPQRTADEKGHIFVSDLEYEVLSANEILTETVFGGYRYWTTHKDIPEDICSYVIDERGYEELVKRHSNKYDIVSFWIERDEELRNVSQERKDRDKEMFTKPYWMYNFVVINNSHIETACFSIALDLGLEVDLD